MEIKLDKKGWLINGKYKPLVAGEFEFWRHNDLFWENTLVAMKETGLDIVSTFLCWDFHEIAPGVYDFIGKTNGSRNLVKFLDLCEKHNMEVIIRPGPIIDAEWVTRGPAPDVCNKERLDPEFLKRTHQWIESVCKILVPRQATKGGSIILLGIDDEVFFPYCSDGNVFEVDGDTYISYKRELVELQYQKWLKEKYKDISRLNREFDTNFATFQDIKTPEYSKINFGLTRLSFYFVNYCIMKYLQLCRDMYREAGVEIPTYTNIKQFLTYIDWPQIEKMLDSGGINICMPDMMPKDQWLVANWFYRLQLARFKFPWSPEFQSGWIGLDDVYGFISPEHFEYMAFYGMACGLRGMSFFMFVERDDWNYSPINLMGKVRPNRIKPAKKVISILKQLVPDRHLANVGLIWILEHNQMFFANKSKDWSELFKEWLKFDEEKELPEWWETFRELNLLDIDFDLIDPRVSNFLGKRIIIYAGPDLIGEACFKSLYEAVRQGAKLIVTTQLPTKNLKGLESKEIKNLSEKFLELPNVILSKPTQLKRVMKNIGKEQFVTTCGNGIQSFLYKYNRRYFLFICNNTEDEKQFEVKLSSEIFGKNEFWMIKEFPDGDREKIKSVALMRYQARMFPKSVRIFAIEST